MHFHLIYLLDSQDQYNNLPVDVKVTQLLAAIHASTLEEQARSMAAVILRRLFASDFQEFYSVVSVKCTCCVPNANQMSHWAFDTCTP